MPKAIEKKIAARGGAARYRTIQVPGGKYLRVAITRKAGPQGGRTVATSTKPKTPQEESLQNLGAQQIVDCLLR